MNQVYTLTAGGLRIVFEADRFRFKEIRNIITDKTYLAGGTYRLIARPLDAVSDPAFLTEIKSVKEQHGVITFIFGDEANRYICEMKIDGTPEGVRFRAKVIGPTPLWMIEWEVGALEFDEVIIPALGGQSLGSGMPRDTTLSYKYPFWWNAQFAIGSSGNDGILFQAAEEVPRMKMLRVRKSETGFRLVYGFECNGLHPSETLEGEWSVRAFHSGWRSAVDMHREWMESAYRLLPVERHTHFPGWMRDINFILEMWGIGKEQPEPLHTFDEMKRRLDEFASLHRPERTLVYVSGWAEHGIDSRAPDYNPSEELGGSKKFKEFVDHARKLGYRVMIHTNVLAMTFSHSLFRKFEKYQVVDVFGRKQSWGLDMDGDWLAEPYFAYINPGYAAWGDLMESVIGNLVRSYAIDAVFLDQTLLAFNVGAGPDFLKGMRDHIERLQQAFPEILFGGEGINEYILRALPYVQIHGIDSIADVHGMEGRAEWRRAHPVSTYLMGKYTRFGAHLLTKHPSHPMFQFQEAAYEKLSVIPALVLYNNKQEIDLPEVRKMIARAERGIGIMPD